jgi:HlyD family secretion protein
MTLLIVLISGIGFLIFNRATASKAENGFQFALVTKGDLENTVSSTGTLVAVDTVAVGTQLSGIIEKILVDFNAQVKKGQVLAVIDTTLAKATVQDAEAGVAQKNAQLAQARTESERNQALFNQGYLP